MLSYIGVNNIKLGKLLKLADFHLHPAQAILPIHDTDDLQ